jgi:hypothetical protein
MNYNTVYSTMICAGEVTLFVDVQWDGETKEIVIRKVSGKRRSRGTTISVPMNCVESFRNVVNEAAVAIQ